MPLYFRIVLLCLAIFGAWSVVRALRTGIIYVRGSTLYARDKDFRMYAFSMFVHLVGIAACLWLAAGYTAADFFTPLGLAPFFLKP